MTTIWTPVTINSTTYLDNQTTKKWDDGTWDQLGATSSDQLYYWDGINPNQVTQSSQWTPASINSTTWS